MYAKNRTSNSPKTFAVMVAYLQAQNSKSPTDGTATWESFEKHDREEFPAQPRNFGDLLDHLRPPYHKFHETCGHQFVSHSPPLLLLSGMKMERIVRHPAGILNTWPAWIGAIDLPPPRLPFWDETGILKGLSLGWLLHARPRPPARAYLLLFPANFCGHTPEWKWNVTLDGRRQAWTPPWGLILAVADR